MNQTDDPGASALSVMALAEAVRDIASRKTAEESLQAVVDLAVASGPCDAASVTLLTGTNLQTVASSDDRVRLADELQYQLGEGPCHDSVFTDGLFVVGDVAADGRWPRWSPEAAGLGIGAVLAVHLYTDTAVGALNLYSRYPRVFTGAEVETARVIGAHASVILAYTRATRNLWQAIESRALIGQAQGMLMARYGLTEEAAFGLLRRYSQTLNVKLAAVAVELTRTGELPVLDLPDPTATDHR
jgi:transcriptional regulator with GAF, ATPase, and Fis domain